jgi:hypothetical protein
MLRVEWQENWSSIPGKNRDTFSSPQRPDRFGDKTRRLSRGYRDLFGELKRPERETQYLPPPNVEFKNARSYISTSPYVFIVWYLIKHRDKFKFAFICNNS